MAIATTVLTTHESDNRGAGGGWSARFRFLRGSGVRRLAGIILAIVAWEVLSATGVLDPLILPGPGSVLSAGGHMIADGELQTNLSSSLQRVFWGVLIGLVAGVGISLFSGLSQLGESLVDGPMQVVRALPVIALQSLFIVWFGIGDEMKVLMIAFAVSIPIYINTYAGIRGVDRRFVELAHGVRLTRWQLIRRVVLPGALPNFLVGLRYALAVAWLVLIFGEEVNTTSGIGNLIIQAGQTGETTVIIVCLVVYGVLGLLSDFVVRLLERRALAWRRGLGTA
ncbi:MAG TPA: ABC transporter permease [Acidimicrobiales bacterium]